MTESEIIEIVRRTMREELAPILMGKVTATTEGFRASAQRFSGENPIDNMRLIQPYGFASRPPAGMESVIEPVAGDPTHMNVTGQNDTGRPPLQPGESALYGPTGKVVYMKADGAIHQGAEAASEPVVLGNVLVDFMTHFIDSLLNATQIGFDLLGPVFLDPTIRTQLIQYKQTYLTAASTNIIGQKNFVERGDS